MTFGRWLLIHSFSIFLVVLFIMGYVYREELQLEQAYQQLLNLEPEQEIQQPLVEKKKQQPPVAPSATEAKPDTLAVKPVDNAQPVAQPDKLEITSIPTVSEPHFKQNERLLMARKAYWEKDYPLSIRRYQQLINEAPGNPDYYGELGNIYYALNDDQRAAKAYYQAAMVLLDQNQPQRARQLLSPITAMNRSLGDELRKKLQ